jgi:hypothetical protein
MRRYGDGGSFCFVHLELGTLAVRQSSTPALALVKYH